MATKATIYKTSLNITNIEGEIELLLKRGELEEYINFIYSF